MFRLPALMLSLLVASSTFAADALWPPKNPADLIGRVGCDFPEDSGIGLYGVPVFGQPDFRLEYRKKGRSRQYVMLMKRRGAEWCDAVVVSAVELPRRPERMRVGNELYDRYAVSLECRYFGVEWTTTAQAFGILDQRLSSGYFLPWRAWRVDTAEGKLTPVDNDLVVCANFSIHDSRGNPKNR